MSFYQYVLCFFIYAFIGYLSEVAYCSIRQKKLVNRGFLYSPICPIYGYGSILVLLTMTPIKNLGAWFFPLVFIAGTLLVSTLEYLTSYFMEKIFHMRWWDYSHYKFQIQGRVCLLNSTLFGIMIMALMYLVHPFVETYILNNLNEITLYVIDGVLFTIMVVDTVFSTIKNVNIAKVVKKMNELSALAKEKVTEFGNTAKEKLTEIGNTAKEKVTDFGNTAKDTMIEAKKEIVAKLTELTKKYPNLKLRKIGKDHTTVEEYIEENKKKEE